MDVLIMSCGTGGGHHAAARALQEEMERRGHRAELLDPYTLRGKKTETIVNNCYIKTAQKAPRLFGLAYRIGGLYRRLPVSSPVYWANHKAAGALKQYLLRHHYDVILITHLFPGEILTHMKKNGDPVPPVIFVATDYTCIPFTEEIICDYYVVPAPDLVREFRDRGIPQDKIRPYGIPVRRAFETSETRAEILNRLHLERDRHYILLSGGSIGAGKMVQTARLLLKRIARIPDARLIIICGNNAAVYKKLDTKKNRRNPQLILIRQTGYMAELMKISDMVLSKPGGLSSTEAAAAQAPLIHLAPIPGCETVNAEYFAGRGMSIFAGNKRRLLSAMKRLQEPREVTAMQAKQALGIPRGAAARICDLAEECGDRIGESGIR